MMQSNAYHVEIGDITVSGPAWSPGREIKVEVRPLAQCRRSLSAPPAGEPAGIIRLSGQRAYLLSPHEYRRLLDAERRLEKMEACLRDMPDAPTAVSEAGAV